VVFRAEVQRLLSRHDPTLGWGSVAMGGVEVHTVPGIHEQILQEPAVRVLAPKLAAVLQASRTRS
jgi:thioesterase domain-containing protein